MVSVIPSDFHSFFLALWSSISIIFVKIFIDEHAVFLPNESSAKTLATCISIFSVEYHNFYVQKCSVFVRSFWPLLFSPCSLAVCTRLFCQTGWWVPLTVNRLFLPLKSNPHLLLKSHASIRIFWSRFILTKRR